MVVSGKYGSFCTSHLFLPTSLFDIIDRGCGLGAFAGAAMMGCWLLLGLPPSLSPATPLQVATRPAKRKAEAGHPITGPHRSLPDQPHSLVVYCCSTPRLHVLSVLWSIGEGRTTLSYYLLTSYHRQVHYSSSSLLECHRGPASPEQPGGIDDLPAPSLVVAARSCSSSTTDR